MYEYHSISLMSTIFAHSLNKKAFWLTVSDFYLFLPCQSFCKFILFLALKNVHKNYHCTEITIGPPVVLTEVHHFSKLKQDF